MESAAPDTVHGRFAAAATRFAARTAVVDGADRLTYAELDELSTALAAELSRAGVGALVGLRLRRGVQAVAAILAVLKAGAGYVPVDPEYPPARQEYILADSAVSLLLTDAPGEGERVLSTHGPLSLVRREGAAREVPAGTCYVIYTSGSTGEPKGCLVGHEHVLGLMDGTAPLFDFDERDVWTLFHSLSFDFSVWELWGPLLSGGTLVVVGKEAANDPAALAGLLAEHRVTVLNQVPSVFGFLLRECELNGLRLTELRYVVFGGEAVNLDDVRRWTAVGIAPGAKMINMYGITETTVHVTYCHLTADLLAGQVGGRTPIGTPLPHLHVSLRDEDGRPVPDGTPGEMWVAGTGVTHGYLDRPELTGQRFVVDGADGGARRYYRSGDWAVRADGAYHYIGRIDGQVKVRGFRIELGEVESVLRTAPGIGGCACGVERTRTGQPMLVAYLVSADHTGLDPEPLRTLLSRALPAHLRPQRLKQLAGLPLSANGKLDRAALPGAAHTLLR